MNAVRMRNMTMKQEQERGEGRDQQSEQPNPRLSCLPTCEADRPGVTVLLSMPAIKIYHTPSSSIECLYVFSCMIFTYQADVYIYIQHKCEVYCVVLLSPECVWLQDEKDFTYIQWKLNHLFHSAS